MLKLEKKKIMKMVDRGPVLDFCQKKIMASHNFGNSIDHCLFFFFFFSNFGEPQFFFFFSPLHFQQLSCHNSFFFFFFFFPQFFFFFILGRNFDNYITEIQLYLSFSLYCIISLSSLILFLRILTIPLLKFVFFFFFFSNKFEHIFNQKAPAKLLITIPKYKLLQDTH